MLSSGKGRVALIGQLRGLNSEFGKSSKFGTAAGVLLFASSVSVGNAADTTDDPLYTASLPANAFTDNTKAITGFVFGTTAANGNNKTIKAKFGATTIVSSGTVTSNGLAWSLEFYIGRIGVGSQIAWATLTIGTTIIADTISNSAEDETGAIAISVTGASPTAGAANDVVGKGAQMNLAN